MVQTTCLHDGKLNSVTQICLRGGKPNFGYANLLAWWIVWRKLACMTQTTCLHYGKLNSVTQKGSHDGKLNSATQTCLHNSRLNSVTQTRLHDADYLLSWRRLTSVSQTCLHDGKLKFCYWSTKVCYEDLLAWQQRQGWEKPLQSRFDWLSSAT